MDDYIATFAVAGSIAVLLLGLIYVLPYTFGKDEPPITARAPRMSAQTAHTLMQVHRRCSIEDCPHKRDAYRTLVAVGAITPDLRAERYMR
ncbi:hypothetical protein IU510_23085 [Nocardia cyriacigeorgica]|uniref:hypothetical protein n=1 Tax=Nocardia cyriacigeorgica TaxID=135487 RepID=UPI00189393DB|nr:hypothetical protein [Nocardia cyriacigeorgica]MBF6100934.1 hypothetical protein [Nocardia cyriacigeorgica]MBF6160392.1 hypothetical protein [Nocardia cyriacigeorgica]MBF6199477.1 hypothetical protein [Nocardia cyriacigeorgica]MBF6315334.1 hypothetical protein [Nocardia cyriacigeorgica]MBF6515791.1 hypothetical protein [Nocardia cyriacigeorgica]